MSIILTIVAIPEKLYVLLIRFCITMSSRFAISVTQICILMAWHFHHKSISGGVLLQLFE